MSRLTHLHPRKRRNQRGFSLVELLVVLSVGMIGLTGLLALVVSAIKGNQVSTSSAEAVEVCEESMEELRSMTIASIEGLSPYSTIDETGWGPVAYHAGDVFGRNNLRFKRTVEARQLPAAQFPGLILLRVNVEWADDGADVDAADPATHHLVFLEMLRNREDSM